LRDKQERPPQGLTQVEPSSRVEDGAFVLKSCPTPGHASHCADFQVTEANPAAFRAELHTWLTGLMALGASSLPLLLQSHLLLNHPPPGTLDC
jgi:hypothetical protein